MTDDLAFGFGFNDLACGLDDKMMKAMLFSSSKPQAMSLKSKTKSWRRRRSHLSLKPQAQSSVIEAVGEVICH